MTARADRITAFLNHSGWGDVTPTLLAGDASFRRYYRLTRDKEQAVLMDAPPPQEDVRPFITIARHLQVLGYAAPAILAADEEAGLLLLEDLGDDTYTRLLKAGVDEESLYRPATDLLADLARRSDAIPAGFTPAYDDARLLTEARLLTDWYIPAVRPPPLSDAAQADYDQLWQALFPVARSMPNTLVLRDFHVDNLLRLPRPGLQTCGLLDFQDAVIGPLTYDIMSLLEDARRDIDPALVARLKDRFFQQVPGLSRPDFEASWAVMAAQRHAKVIGIFTRLLKRDGKPIYLQHIPRVWRLLEAACAHPVLHPLKAWLDREIPASQRTVPQP